MQSPEPLIFLLDLIKILHSHVSVTVVSEPCCLKAQKNEDVAFRQSSAGILPIGSPDFLKEVFGMHEHTVTELTD